MNESPQRHPEPGPSPAPPQPAPPQTVSSAATDPRTKSPVMACCLSLMPGLGQIYVGYYQRGFLNAIIIAVLITLLASDQLYALTPLVGLFLAFFWLYNMIDAARRATLYNQSLAGGQQPELPADFESPGARGSLAGGASLIVLGVLLLANTRFEMSLDWLAEWWPAAVILFGGYLFWKGLQERAGESESG